MAELQGQLSSGPTSTPGVGTFGALVAATHRVRRRVLVAAVGTAVVGLVGFGPAAVADVNVSPTRSQQGGAEDITFQVRNDRPGVSTSKVEVIFPSDHPVGEIYPLSVDDWAPAITTVDLDQPVAGIHTATVLAATSAITWTRVASAPKKAPPVEELRISMGPMPQVAELVFTVVQTYSDGKVRRWSGPTSSGAGTVLTLDPGTGEQSAHAGMAMGGMSGMEGMEGMDMSGSSATAGAAPVTGASAGSDSASGGGSEIGLIVGGVAGGLVLGALAAFALLRRSRPTTAPAPSSSPTPLKPAVQTPLKPAVEALAPAAVHPPARPAPSSGVDESPDRGGLATATRTSEPAED